MANKMIEKYNTITGRTVAGAIDKGLDRNTHTNWQTMIADNQVFNVSGEKPVAYQGVNAINLAISNANRGNTDNRFMTRNQAEKVGFSIRDKAKAMAVSYLQSQDREVDGKTVKIPFMRVAYVYNAKDIKGIGKPQEIENNDSVVFLNAEKLIKQSSIEVVRSKWALRSQYNAKTNKIEIASALFDQKSDGFVTAYAILASKVAVEKNYVNDSKDMQSFKWQMSAALITQKAGAKFKAQGNLISTLGEPKFNTDFLKDPAIGMKAMRSSAKIANFVIEGKSFEMTKDKSKADDKGKAKAVKEKAKTTAKTKGPAAKALAKRRSKTNERASLSR